MSDPSAQRAVDKTPEEDTSHIPYVLPQAVPPTTACSGLPTISTLPPIATARPQQPPTQYAHLSGNIPVVNGVRQTQPPPQPQYAPTVVNLSAAPSAAAPHLPAEMRQPPPPPFFEYMDKCRYAAGFMLCYYVCTFLFLQPFFLGVLGILAGFLGYYGSRPPIFAAHIKWVRGYLWMNMSLLVMNVWYAAIMLFFLSTPSRHSNSNDDANIGGGDSATSYYDYDEGHLGIFIGVIIGLNLVLHVRGVRTARCFYAEMLRAGPLPGQRTIIVMGNPA